MEQQTGALIEIGVKLNGLSRLAVIHDPVARFPAKYAMPLSDLQGT